MTERPFYDKRSEQSLIKATIVSKYFWAWAKVMLSNIRKYPKSFSNRIAYVDLFSGPGRYKDGSESTPILILKKAIENPDIRDCLVTKFNDKDKKTIDTLRTEIQSIPDLNQLKYQPQFLNEEIGAKLVQELEHIKQVPTLWFIDPWGYKGLTLRLINRAIIDWGCDCIFFFNYNRINMGLTNELVVEHMNALFGKERSDDLRERLQVMSTPSDREMTIVNELTSALKEPGRKYVLPFGFRDDCGTRTKHHLILVTKHVRGYEKMKEVMAKYSSTNNQGVPSLQYSPADERFPMLFELSRPLDDLIHMLPNDFAGKTLRMKQVYEKHHVDKPYIKSNYKSALIKLEEQGKIKTSPPANQRRKNKGKVSFGDNVKVTFPEKSKDKL